MSQKSFSVKVTADFDPVSFDGALVLCDSFSDGIYFDQQGYDGGERDDCKVLEVVPTFENPADDAALRDIVVGLGFDPANDDGDDSILPNVVCRHAHVRAALEAAGYDAVVSDMGVMDGSRQYGCILVWRQGTFDVLAEVGQAPLIGNVPR